ncbi:porimin [Rana temporaria]|uniref:porimin n=1 Tax=Rana temporaria TaxID=8407 RepID=UPI001AACDABD|nr:porimin [Rana temporaria]
MRMMDGSRGWIWTAVLLLAALSMCLAADTPDGSVPPTLSAKNSSASDPVVLPNTTQAATTTKASAVTNATTAAVPKTSPSSTPAKPSTAAPPPPTSPTTKGPPPPTPSTATSTTVTSKGTLKPTATSPTQGSSTTVSPVTSTISSGTQKISGFDLGSFIGGIVLTLSILAIAYFGCRFYNSRRGVRYRTIDEHEAII